jgi:hypothetical protein
LSTFSLGQSVTAQTSDGPRTGQVMYHSPEDGVVKIANLDRPITRYGREHDTVWAKVGEVKPA